VKGGLDPAERRTLRLKASKATLDALRSLGGESTREEIREWARIHGGFTKRELDALPPEGGRGKYRCAVDHQLSWTLTNLKRDGLVENPKWGTWKLTETASTGAPSPRERVDAKRVAELRTMPYHRYLRTPEWRRTRAAALLRAGNACSLDVDHTENLEVHHRSYKRLGAELPTDLLVLCRPCHQLHHGEYGLPRREPSGFEQAARAAPRRLLVGSEESGEKQRKPSLLRRLLAG
jgi:restriction endonuclease Mrr